MLIPPFLIPYLKLFYPIKEPLRTRDRPLKIIAVGLSRSGTDSLRAALKLLGYNECHHASVFIAEEPRQGPQWCRLAWRKYHTSAKLSPAKRGLDATEFDKCIGNCMATTDIPGASFACELVRAYPNARVIVNKREDVEAWYQSVLKTFGTSSPIGKWSIALFDAELFWLKAGRDAVWSHMVEYDFARTGKDVYRKHYAAVDELLESEKAAGRERKVLRWQVENGWDGLLEFLGKKLPIDRETGMAMEFPSGNEVPEFHRRRMAATVEKVRRAEMRRTIVVTFVIGLAVSSRVWFWLR
jgi:hypothetical protein